jgi:hypothetical protein
VNSSELFLGESDGNLCGCHTGIIPLRHVPNKAIPNADPGRSYAIGRLRACNSWAACNINSIKTVDNG